MNYPAPPPPVYQQPVYYQQPYYTPPVPTSDPIDQIAKVASLLETLKRSDRPQSQQQPGSISDQFDFRRDGNVSQFQGQQQSTYDAQQRAYGLQPQQQQPQTVLQPPQQTLDPDTARQIAELCQQLRTLAAYTDGLERELSLAYSVINSSVPFINKTQILLRENEQQQEVIENLKPFVTAALCFLQETQLMDNILDSVVPLFFTIPNLLNESEMGYKIASAMEILLYSPEFVTLWAFELLNKQQLTQHDLNVVSQLFLELSEKYAPTPPSAAQILDLKNPDYFNPAYQPPLPRPQQQPALNYVPEYQQQPSQQIPLPVPSNNNGTGDRVAAMQAVVEMLRNPQGAQTAMQLQRMRSSGLI